MGCNVTKVTPLESIVDLTSKNDENWGLVNDGDSNLEITEKSVISSWKNLVISLLRNKKLTQYIRSDQAKKVTSLQKLEDLILKSPAKNKLEQTWLIYYWIAEYVRFDISLINLSIDYEVNLNDVVALQKATCYGYSDLLKYICKKCDINCETIKGYSRSPTQSFHCSKTDHAWNAVYLNEKWNLVDCTWAAGYVSSKTGFVKEFQPFYFFTPPEVFIYQHCSKDYQLLKRSLSINEFMSLPFYKIGYFIHGFSEIENLKTIENTTEVALKLFAKGPSKMRLKAKLIDANNKEVEKAVISQRNPLNNKFEISIHAPEQNMYRVKLYSGETDNKRYRYVGEIFVKMNSNKLSSGKLCEVFDVQDHVYLYEPLDYFLISGISTRFMLHANAKSVAIFDQTNNRINLQKDENENVWTCDYNLSIRGNLNLSICFKDGENYQTAFSYLVI